VFQLFLSCNFCKSLFLNAKFAKESVLADSTLVRDLNTPSPKFLVMKKNILLIGICIMITMSSCLKSLLQSEEVKKLPKVTQNGAHTFGCKVNGEVWVPNGIHEIYGTSIAALTASFCAEPITLNLYITITAIKDHENFVEDLHIRINSNTTGTYILNGSQQPGYHYPSYCSFGNAETDSLRTGIVVITKIDNTNNIIAGTFEFTGIDRRDGKIHKITEGRFDAKTR